MVRIFLKTSSPRSDLHPVNADVPPTSNPAAATPASLPNVRRDIGTSRADATCELSVFKVLCIYILFIQNSKVAILASL
jgi:hypothetical protein